MDYKIIEEAVNQAIASLEDQEQKQQQTDYEFKSKKQLNSQNSKEEQQPYRIRKYIVNLTQNIEIFQEASKVIQKKNRFIRKLFLFLGYSNIFVFILFYSYFTVKQTFPSEDLYDQFIDNQNKDIIEDIIALQNTNKCPQEYENLFEYHWAGTNPGCDCSQQMKQNSKKKITDQEFFSRYFHVGSQCNQTLKQNGCKTLFDIEEKYLNQLNDNNFSKPFLLCAKRTKGISLRNNFTYCNQQEKTICGSGTFTYCLPKEVNCPISEIGFTYQSDYLSKQNKTVEGKVIKATNSLYFYQIKNQSQMPISQVKMTETSNVCKINSQNNISPDRQDYFLMKTHRQHCQFNDSQFKVVGSFNEDQFYLANSLNYLKLQQSYFNINSSVIWTLQTKAYTLIDTKCQQFQDEYNSFLEKEDINQIREINSYINLILLRIILTHCIQLKTKLKSNFYFFGLLSADSLFITCLRIANIIIYIGIFITIIIIYDQKIRIQEHFFNFTSSQCIITESARSIYDFDQIQDSGEIIAFYIIIAILQIFLVLISLLKCVQDGIQIDCQCGRGSSQFYNDHGKGQTSYQTIDKLPQEFINKQN